MLCFAGIVGSRTIGVHTTGVVGWGVALLWHTDVGAARCHTPA